MIQPSSLQFLKQLKKNNSKEWFDQNRGKYDEAKIDFLKFIGQVIEKHSLSDSSIADQEAKSCIYRINRDIRFSKNKTPYKTNLAASITVGGKKSKYAGYYFHMEPGSSFVGGGLWMPEANELKNIRQEIDYNQEEFESILQDKKFVRIYKHLDTTPEYKLSRPPRGYDDTNPAIEHLKLKSFIAMAPIKDKEITDENFLHQITDALGTIQPLIKFLNRGIDG